MQRTEKHRLAAILLALLFFTTSQVNSDGCYFSRRAVAVSADQRAIIVKNGDEISMTFSTGYTGEGEDFGWIIPTPSIPEIDDISEALEKGTMAFALLDEYTAPVLTISAKSKGCFPPGTEVLTADGPVAIERIREGTEVYAFDFKSGMWTLSKVSRAGAYYYRGDVITIQTGWTSIQATGNHPFFVLRGNDLTSRPFAGEVPKAEQVMPSRGRWVEARYLEKGDLLMSRNAGNLAITGVAGRNVRTEVFHIEVEGHHNYAIHQAGILVHNGGKGESAASLEAEESPVTVFGHVVLEHYEVSVVKATDASALFNWLRENGYQVDPGASEVIEMYVDRNWAFVAVKLNPGEKRSYDNEFLPPLTIAYRHNELVFPLKISSVSTVDTVSITLYVVAGSTVTSSNFPTNALKYDYHITEGVDPEEYIEACILKTLDDSGPRGLVATWKGRFYGKRLTTVVAALTKIPFSEAQPFYLTRLETRMDPATMTEDIEIVLDPKPRSFQVNIHANEGYDYPSESKKRELIAACQIGETETVKELLAAGVDIDAQDKDMRTALMVAVRSNHTKIIEILLDADAKVNTSSENTETALTSAARLGEIDVVEMLLNAGADVNALRQFGDTALMSAAAHGHSEIVKVLIAAGAAVNARASEGSGLTALMRAAGKPRYVRDGGGGHVEIVRILLDSGADVHERDQFGETALMMAADGGHIEIVRILLGAGANVHDRTDPDKYYGFDDKTTALFSAASRGHAEVTEILIQAGADVNAATPKGETALISASGNGHAEVVRMLTEAGADIGARSKQCTYPGGSTTTDPLTALMWAARRGHAEVAKVLIRAGADVNATSARGKTVLAMTKEEGQSDVAEILEQAGARE